MLIPGNHNDDLRISEHEELQFENRQLRTRISCAERAIERLEAQVFKFNNLVVNSNKEIGRRIDDWQENLKSSVDFDGQIAATQQAFIKLKKEKDEMMIEFEKMRRENNELASEQEKIKALLEEMQNEAPWICNKCHAKWNQLLGEISDEEWEDDDS